MLRGFVHARIWNSDATAFLVEDGRFTKVGTDAEIQAELAAADETVDLNGLYVYPGFADSHLHLVGLGFYLSMLQLSGCRSVQDIQELVKKRLEQKEPWVIGRGYNEDNFDSKRRPLKADLDAVSIDVPIALTRVDGHVMVCNSKALELAGITEKTDIDGGAIDFERGVLEETAMNLVHKAWPKPDADTIEKYIRTGMKECNRYGITSVGSDDFVTLNEDYRPILAVFSRMAFQQSLTVRVNEQCEFASLEDFRQFLEDGYTQDTGDDFFRIGPLKLVADGTLGAHTASLSVPYVDNQGTMGYECYSTEDLNEYIRLAAYYNMAAIVHAIGDETVDTVLDIFKDVVLPGNPLHHGFVHCQITRPEQLQEMIRMQLNCYFQSLFIDYDASILESRVGPELAASSYAFRTLFEGTDASNGSDAPVEMPDVLKGIQLAVTRRSLSHPQAAMNPGECLSPKQALESYTAAGYKAFDVQDRLGAIQEGYLADFAVLDTDIEHCEPETIAKGKVMMTVMNGETVYER